MLEYGLMFDNAPWNVEFPQNGLEQLPRSQQALVVEGMKNLTMKITQARRKGMHA